MMATAYIIDDESQSAKLLKAKMKDLTSYFDQIETFINPVLAYQAIVQHAPDIIFSDIEMPIMCGTDIPEKIKHLNIPLVYVTAFSSYSITAIKQQVFDYILKPVKEQELLDTINKFIAWKQLQVSQSGSIKPSFNEILFKQNSKISINTIESINLISINRIVHVEGVDNYSKFNFQDKSTMLSSRTLKYFETQLDQFGFLRIHKSHLVNMVYVDKLITKDGGYLQLATNELIPFTRDKKMDIIDWYKV